nr:2-dehydropantoate 2-reductase N-terminal domain-containing protein [Bradyrhizobium pachyrhizi]
MRICIFGAGAVGSHFAVRLARAGHNVSCVMRGPHLDAVRTSGLTLKVGDSSITARVKASADPADLGPQDIVISTLKAPASARSQPGCRRCFRATRQSCSRRTAFPGGTISACRRSIPRFLISASSIPAGICAAPSRRSGSSAA